MFYAIRLLQYKLTHKPQRAEPIYEATTFKISIKILIADKWYPSICKVVNTAYLQLKERSMHITDNDLDLTQKNKNKENSGKCLVNQD